MLSIQHLLTTSLYRRGKVTSNAAIRQTRFGSERDVDVNQRVRDVTRCDQRLGIWYSD